MGDVNKVIACFKEIGFVPSIDSFQDRLIAQKVNCLLNFSGINTGFNCNLYIRGPYSPDLADALFEQKEKFSNLETIVTLNENEKQITAEIKNIFGLNASYLEIGSTYAYLTIKNSLKPVEAIKTIKKMKPFFTESQIAIGVSRSKELLSKPSKKLIDKIRKESEMWDTASTPLILQGN